MTTPPKKKAAKAAKTEKNKASVAQHAFAKEYQAWKDGGRAGDSPVRP